MVRFLPNCFSFIDRFLPSYIYLVGKVLLNTVYKVVLLSFGSDYEHGTPQIYMYIYTNTYSMSEVKYFRTVPEMYQDSSLLSWIC